MRTLIPDAHPRLLRIAFPAMACSPSLRNLPLARLTRHRAGIDPRDAASGLSRSSGRGDCITVNPVDDLNTSLLSRATECRRLAAQGLCIEAVNVHVHGVGGDRQDSIARRGHRGIRAVRVGIRLPHDLRLQRVLPRSWDEYTSEVQTRRPLV